MENKNQYLIAHVAQVLTNQEDANLALRLGFWKLPWAKLLTL